MERMNALRHGMMGPLGFIFATIVLLSGVIMVLVGTWTLPDGTRFLYQCTSTCGSKVRLVDARAQRCECQP